VAIEPWGVYWYRSASVSVTLTVGRYDESDAGWFLYKRQRKVQAR